MPRERETAQSLSPLKPPISIRLVAGLAALKVAILLMLAWKTRFVMDEFGQLGFAKHLGNGMFETVWPAKAVGAQLFYKIAHVIGSDAVSILLTGRLQTALLGCAILAMIYACARENGEDRSRALIIVLVLLCFSNFIERIFRTIAEPLALFFAVAALLVILRGQADRVRTLITIGLLSGLAFLTTQKSAYFNLAMGVGLVADAALAGRYVDGLRRGAWLVFGWLAAVASYCLLFGGLDPLPIARHLVFGPVDVATTGADDYPTGLRHFVLQTLTRNTILYGFCFAGALLSLLRFWELAGGRRISLIFTIVITVLVFTHDQPWPYVFIMALPFLALWALVPIDVLRHNPLLQRLAWLGLASGVLLSFWRNVFYLGLDNRAQLDVISRAEKLVGPSGVYFDGIGMLPNRREPSTLWLDKKHVQKTLREGASSEAFQIFSERPPKVIIWTYRMDRIEPVVGWRVRESYAQISPNVRLAGRLLKQGQKTAFNVPVAAGYRLYDRFGNPVSGKVSINGVIRELPLRLPKGHVDLTLLSGPKTAFLVPEAAYSGRFLSGPDRRDLFDKIYD